MADCHKCGARLRHKRPDGRRKCKHCGFAGGKSHLSRSGEVTWTPVPMSFGPTNIPDGGDRTEADMRAANDLYPYPVRIERTL